MDQAWLKLNDARVRWHEVDGEIMAVDLVRDEYLSLNETAAVIWSAMVEGTTTADLVRELVERFAVSSDTAMADVDRFVATLRARDLIA